MTDNQQLLDLVEKRLLPFGLFVQTIVQKGDVKNHPWPLIDAVDAASVLIIGHRGASHWPAFEDWLASQSDAENNPLDSWSKEVLGPLAEMVGGTAIYPNDRPYYPFQRWAMAGGEYFPSPLGLLVHAQFGLWHGFRGAIALAQKVQNSVAAHAHHPCDTCQDKPCLTACPVSAFDREGFDVVGCRSHLSGIIGADIHTADNCMSGGCKARNACPLGSEYHYITRQLQFHMRAFRGSGN